MSELSPITAGAISDGEVYAWVGKVLTNFAIAEQAIGKLCVRLELSISSGSLTSLSELRPRLQQSVDRKCRLLDVRIGRWMANRPYRHLLAHASIYRLRDDSGCEVIITRHLPRDLADVTPDRMWTIDDRVELLRQATNDGRSISDHVAGLLSDPARLALLRGPS